MAEHKITELEALAVQLENELAENQQTAQKKVSAHDAEINELQRMLGDAQQSLMGKDALVECIKQQLADAEERAANIEGQMEALQVCVLAAQAVVLATSVTSVQHELTDA